MFILHLPFVITQKCIHYSKKTIISFLRNNVRPMKTCCFIFLMQIRTSDKIKMMMMIIKGKRDYGVKIYS